MLSACLVVMLASCEFDNYDGPAATLEGRIVYNGEAIGVSYNDVNFELWEPGWVKKTVIPVAVSQDGSFSALLFDATYKLIIPSYQGPFKTVRNSESSSDTILLDLRGSTTLDIEVMPYFMIRDPQFSVSGRTVSSSCDLEKIITGVDEKSIERVSLYISKTSFVDSRTSIATRDLSGADIVDMTNIALTIDVPDVSPSQNYVFARIGVKISGVEDMIFSPVQQMQL